MKIIKTILATALLATATSTLVYANIPEQQILQLQQGIAAIEKGDLHTAFNLVKPLAEQGNVLAQSLLGAMYHDGEVVQQDYQQAAKWFQKAAEQGNVDAQVRLGLMYGLGEDVKRNHKQAKIWFGKACKNGDQKACDILKELK